MGGPTVLNELIERGAMGEKFVIHYAALPLELIFEGCESYDPTICLPFARGWIIVNRFLRTPFASAARAAISRTISILNFNRAG